MLLRNETTAPLELGNLKLKPGVNTIGAEAWGEVCRMPSTLKAISKGHLTPLPSDEPAPAPPSTGESEGAAASPDTEK